MIIENLQIMSSRLQIKINVANTIHLVAYKSTKVTNKPHKVANNEASC